MGKSYFIILHKEIINREIQLIQQQSYYYSVVSSAITAEATSAQPSEELDDEAAVVVVVDVDASEAVAVAEASAVLYDGGAVAPSTLNAPMS